MPTPTESIPSSQTHNNDNLSNPTDITSVIPVPVTSPLPNLSSSKCNTHEMQTRSKFSIFKPKAFSATKEPSTVQEALQIEHCKAAMRDELLALERNSTWSLVPLPPNRKVKGCKGVFQVKENPDGTIHKYKARLVANHLIPRFDFMETFNPVVKPTTIRIIITIAITNGWNIRQLDVNSAFLNGDLKEDVYYVAASWSKHLRHHNWFANFTKLSMDSNKLPELGLRYWMEL